MEYRAVEVTTFYQAEEIGHGYRRAAAVKLYQDVAFRGFKLDIGVRRDFLLGQGGRRQGQ
jgi:hypothetical protein